MKAPKIYIVMGDRYRNGDPIVWSFDEDEATNAAQAINRREGNDFATSIVECDPANSMCPHCGCEP